MFTDNSIKIRTRMKDINLLVGSSNSLNVVFDNYVFLYCNGGSASGLNNPNSVSQYNKAIIHNIQHNNYKHHFFNFGSVDVSFLFLYKYAKNTNINYIEFNLDVINKYLNFITSNFSNKSVIILSIGLPVLDDLFLKKGLLAGVNISTIENENLVELEKQLENVVLPNIYERTKITLHFNEQLENEIKKLNNPNIKFLDITTFTYDDNLKRIKDEFFSRDDFHNYERNVYFTEIINNFLKTLS